jgi:hypothetical protein
MASSFACTLGTSLDQKILIWNFLSQTLQIIPFTKASPSTTTSVVASYSSSSVASITSPFLRGLTGCSWVGYGLFFIVQSLHDFCRQNWHWTSAPPGLRQLKQAFGSDGVCTWTVSSVACEFRENKESFSLKACTDPSTHRFRMVWFVLTDSDLF